MKRKFVMIGLGAVAILGLALFVALRFQFRGTGGGSGLSNTARELVNAAKSLGRDMMGRGPSKLPKANERVLELVPMGTPLEAARQIMTEHHFNCSVDSYDSPTQMSDRAIWNRPFVKGGQRWAVTNVARLKCETNGCVVTFWLINGETTSLSLKGDF